MTDLSGNNSETINIRYNNNYIQYSKNNVTWTNITAFPITITNNTPTDYLTVQFVSNIYITKQSQYFICGSQYIKFDGGVTNNYKCYVQCAHDGLIQNGTTINSGNQNIIIQNVFVHGLNGNLSNGNGWIGQSYFKYGQFINCGSNGNIDGGGGICGSYSCNNAGIINAVNCYFISSISTLSGGIFGKNVGNNGGTANAVNCYSIGSVNGFSGGIFGPNCGRNNGFVSATNCYSIGSINNESGGIFGAYCCQYGGIANAKNCYSVGSINLGSGGIFGHVTGQYNGTANATNCYSIGSINIGSGGIFGVSSGINDGIITANNCYYNGTEYISSTNFGQLAGSNSIISNSTEYIYGYNNGQSIWNNTNAKSILNNTQSIWNETPDNYNIPWTLQSNSPNIITTNNNIYYVYDANIQSTSLLYPLQNPQQNISNIIQNIQSINFGWFLQTIANLCFQNATNLTTCIFNTPNISNPSLTISNLTSIGDNSFQNCSLLNNFNLANTNTLNSIGNYAFQKSGLTSIIILSSVKTIGDYAFNSCPLTDISSNNIIFTTDSYSLINTTTNTILQYTLENTRTTYQIPNNIVNIGVGAFQDAKYLISITLSKNIITIGNDSFNGCLSLNNIIIPDNVQQIQNNSFASCKLLSNFQIGIKGTHLQTMGTNIFNSCENLKSITIIGPPPINVANTTFNNSDITTIYYYSEFNKLWNPKPSWIPINCNIVQVNDGYVTLKSNTNGIINTLFYDLTYTKT
jgi:hypothetical protein